MTRARWLGCFVLVVAARQTDGSHSPDIDLLRYFVFANGSRAGNHWARACVTRVNGEVKVLFFHRGVYAKKDIYQTLGSLRESLRSASAAANQVDEQRPAPQQAVDESDLRPHADRSPEAKESEAQLQLSQSTAIPMHYPCRASFRSTGSALSGLPHSKQSRLARGVINPQNGHILCDPTCWAWGASVDRNLLNRSAMEASRLRSRWRNEPSMGSIDAPSSSSRQLTMTGLSRRF